MAKTYSSFFFHFPPHDSPPPPLPVPPRALTYPPSSHPSTAAATTTPFRSFLSLDADSVRSLDDDGATAYSSRSREHRQPRQARQALPALDTRSDWHSRTDLHSRSSSNSSHSSHADRALPRPKPAPMSTLPAVPASAPPTHTRYPRAAAPSARPNTSPAHHTVRKHMQSQQQHTHPVPRKHEPPSRARPPPKYYGEPPQSPQSPRSPAAHPHRLAAPVRVKPRPRPVSMASSSTVSTRHRVTNRTDALARLEGRVPRSATLPYGPTPTTRYARAVPPPRPPFPTQVASSPSLSPASTPSPRLLQISPPPYSPSAALHRVKSAAPVLATKSFMPFSDGANSDDDESDADEVDGGVKSLGVKLSAGLRLGTDSEDDVEEKVRRGRKASRRTTIASWYVGPESVPKNFMDFGDVDVDVDVYDLDQVWKEHMKQSRG